MHGTAQQAPLLGCGMSTCQYSISAMNISSCPSLKWSAVSRGEAFLCCKEYVQGSPAKATPCHVAEAIHGEPAYQREDPFLPAHPHFTR
eukprot:1144426-Pelagomonas_calceolata.AAC.7